MTRAAVLHPCPRCAAELEFDDQLEAPIGRCPNKDGLLVDDTYIEASIGTEASEKVWELIDAANLSRIRCPLCDGKMKNVLVRRTHIDGCTHDRVVWLDGWEIETFKNPPTEGLAGERASGWQVVNDGVGLHDLAGFLGDLF